jgi:hypothetical protein
MTPTLNFLSTLPKKIKKIIFEKIFENENEREW